MKKLGFFQKRVKYISTCLKRTFKLLKNINFHFFCYSVSGFGLSGGERIFLELGRVLANKKYRVTFYSWERIRDRIKKSSLSSTTIRLRITRIGKWIRGDIFSHYFFATMGSIYCSLFLKEHDIRNLPTTVIYSSSDFWMDIFPCIILKIRFKYVTWLATWYQTAPNPIQGYTVGKRGEKYRVNALLIWLSQLPAKFFIQHLANFVIVNNDDEKKQFKALNKKRRVIVMLGGVDVERINQWKRRHMHIRKKYDAVFQGRFHAQKGVLELIDIWKKVVREKPSAKLAMIGDGPLMSQVKDKIANLSLGKNIDLFGYVFDGDTKYTIFAKSRIVVHPAFYDSGGMASGEAMAFGLPCVGFHLKSYDSYYPIGMDKVQVGNLSAFAKTILLLLSDKDLYKKLAKEAVSLINKEWSWDTKAENLLNILNTNIVF